MQDDRGLKDKIIVITGSCGDIGSATTKKLAALGARVIGFDLWDAKSGKAQAERLGGVDYLTVDVGDPKQVHAGIAEIVSRYKKLDIAIGNAASCPIGRLLDRTAEDWENSLRVNVIGSAMLAQASVKQMLQYPLDSNGIRGRIIFTSSWVSTYPYPGSIDYCASKAALDHFVRLVAQEYAGEGILVNAVAPGILDGGGSRKALEKKPELRQMMMASIPIGKLGTSNQVADAFAFLCSSESAYMTGHILFVDGGCSLTKRE